MSKGNHSSKFTAKADFHVNPLSATILTAGLYCSYGNDTDGGRESSAMTSEAVISPWRMTEAVRQHYSWCREFRATLSIMVGCDLTLEKHKITG